VTENYKGPLAGAYGNSPLSQIAGLGTLLGSAFGTTKDASGNIINTGAGNQLIDWAKGLLSGSSTTPTNPTTNTNTPVTEDQANAWSSYYDNLMRQQELENQQNQNSVDEITNSWEDYYRRLSAGEEIP
jgi:hypothetical protein